MPVPRAAVAQAQATNNASAARSDRARRIASPRHTAPSSRAVSAATRETAADADDLEAAAAPTSGMNFGDLRLWRSYARMVLGAAVWAAIIAGGVRVWASGVVQQYEPIEQFDEFFLEEKFVVTGHYAIHIDCKRGDKLYMRDGVSLKPAGEVLAVRHEHRDPDDPLSPIISTVVDFWVFPFMRTEMTNDLGIRPRYGPEDIGAILELLLDDRVRAEFEREWNSFLERHGDSVRDMVVPFIEGIVTDYIALIGDDINAAIRKRQQQFVDFFTRHVDATIKPKLMPILEEDILPQAESTFAPMINDVVMELVDKAPIGGFIAEYLNDRINPFTDDQNLNRKFAEWMEAEAMPVIRGRIPEIERLLGEMLTEASKNPRVAAALSASIETMLADPELTQIARGVIDDAIVKNPKTSAYFEGLITGPKLLDLLNRIGRLLESYLIRATDTLLLDETKTRINPNLSIVLRAQILWKDDRWFVAELPKSSRTSEGRRLVAQGHHYQFR